MKSLTTDEHGCTRMGLGKRTSNVQHATSNIQRGVEGQRLITQASFNRRDAKTAEKKEDEPNLTTDEHGGTRMGEKQATR